MLTTALEPDEVLCEIRLPRLPRSTGGAYHKYQQPASGYALVGAAAVVGLEDGRISDARVALTGVASHAFRAEATEAALQGHSATPETVAEAAIHATAGQDVQADLFASPRYRAHLASVYARRAIESAIERARA